MPYSIFLQTNCQLNKAEPKPKCLFSVYVSQTREEALCHLRVSQEVEVSLVFLIHQPRGSYSVLERTKQNDSKMSHGCPWQTFPIVNPLWRRCLAELSEKCVLTWEKPLARAAESHVTKIRGKAPNTALPFTAAQRALVCGVEHRQRRRPPNSTVCSGSTTPDRVSVEDTSFLPTKVKCDLRWVFFFSVSFKPKFH